MTLITCCVVSGVAYWLYHNGKCSPSGGAGAASDPSTLAGGQHNHGGDALTDPLLKSKTAQGLKQIVENAMSPDNRTPINNITGKMTDLSQNVIKEAGGTVTRTADFLNKHIQKAPFVPDSLKESAQQASGVMNFGVEKLSDTAQNMAHKGVDGIQTLTTHIAKAGETGEKLLNGVTTTVQQGIPPTVIQDSATKILDTSADVVHGTLAKANNIMTHVQSSIPTK